MAKQEFEQERQILHDYLARHGMRHTHQREIILEEFLRQEQHVTIDDLSDRVRKKDPSIGYATVYRTLKLFTECGIADKREFGGSARFESTSEEHHDHMICNTCGNIIEFHNDEIEHLQDQICQEHNFQLISHKMELYGLCRACQQR